MSRRNPDPNVVKALLAAPTVKDGAAALGIPYPAAYDHLRAARVKVGQAGRSGKNQTVAARTDDIMRSLFAGEPLPAIAARLGISPEAAVQAVAYRIHRARRTERRRRSGEVKP